MEAKEGTKFTKPRTSFLADLVTGISKRLGPGSGEFCHSSVEFSQPGVHFLVTPVNVRALLRQTMNKKAEQTHLNGVRREKSKVLEGGGERAIMIAHGFCSLTKHLHISRFIHLHAATTLELRRESAVRVDACNREGAPSECPRDSRNLV